MPLSLRLALALVGAAGVRAVAWAQAKQSPFSPPASAGAPAAAGAGETLEFAGVSSVGKRTDLIFYDKTTKKSHWVGLGETKEGIAVISYDARREQAAIKLNGVDKLLPLRKGTAPSGGAPAPVQVGFNPAAPAATPVVMAPAVSTIQAPPPVLPAPVVEAPPVAAAKPPAPPVPEGQQKQELEARMLVSDLLEIGMAQRRAYEEAQRKAASGNIASPPTTEPVRQP